MPGGCLHSQQTGTTDVAIIGDSHAQHLYLGIANSAKNANFSFGPSMCKYSGRLGLGLGFGPVNQCSESSATFFKERETYENLIKRSVEPHENLKLIDLSTYFCDAQNCSMARDGELFYRDKNHLNAIGSNYVGQKIVELIGID